MRSGESALARREWADAVRHFEDALDVEESPEAHEGLATALVALVEYARAVTEREAAYRLYHARGDLLAAARMATWLGLDHAATYGEIKVASGWFGRARTLLVGLEPSPEHAWLFSWDAHVALLFSDDLPRSRELIDSGLALARALGVKDVELMTRGLDAFSQVVSGQVREGLSELDEISAATVAGEFQNLEAAGQTCCYVLSASEMAYDFDRADQWREKIVNYGRNFGAPSFSSYCRFHHAAILMWRGRWDDAAAELDAYQRELGAAAPLIVPTGQARLGEVRRRQGRRDEAARLFDQAEGIPAATLGKGWLAFERDDFISARDQAERFLRQLSPEDLLQRAPGLDLLARSMSRLGQHEAATRIASDLMAIATSARTDGLRGAALAVRGTVAREADNLQSARQDLEDAIFALQRSGATFDAARARLELAETLAAEDRVEAALRELSNATEVFDRLGAADASARARQLRSRLQPPVSSGLAPGKPDCGLTERQLEVLLLMARGLSNREIGEQLFLSPATVKRHVADILTRLDLPTRAAAATYAAQHKLL